MTVVAVAVSCGDYRVLTTLFRDRFNLPSTSCTVAAYLQLCVQQSCIVIEGGYDFSNVAAGLYKTTISI